MKSFKVLAFGGNQETESGSPAFIIEKSLGFLKDHGVEPLKLSRFYKTPAFPAGAGPDFVNCVAVVKTNGSNAETMSILHKAEVHFGRQRVTRWGQRTLDIDLLAEGQTVAPSVSEFQHWVDLPIERQMQESPAELILPHPRIQDRAFVLVPFAEVAPDWRHPVFGLSVAEMLAKLPESDVNQVVPL